MKRLLNNWAPLKLTIPVLVVRIWAIVLPFAANAQTLTTQLAVGASPTDIVLNPVTNKIYVTNGYDGTVSIIDAGNNNQIATISVGLNPGALGINPATNRIYVANSGSADVSVIDGGSNAVIANVTVELTPNSIAVNSVTNMIYVSDYSSNRISVINGANNSVTDMNVGVGPQSVALNPVTNKIYVVNKGTSPGYYSSVTVIDGSGSVAPFSILTGGRNAFAATVNPVTNKIYVAQTGGLAVIDGSSGTLVNKIASGSDALTLNPMTNKIYAANWTGGYISVIDGSSQTVVATVTDTAGPFSLTVNPTTNQIYAGNTTGSSATVTVIDGATNATTSVAIGTRSSRVVVNPVTNKLYVLQQNYSPESGLNPDYGVVCVIDGNTYRTTAVVTGAGPFGIALNQVTNQIYSANDDGTVTVINGTNLSTISVGSTTGPYAIAVNPVTNKIYVPSYNTASVQIIDAANNNEVTSVTVGTNPYRVAINPVTNKIYVANVGSNNLTIIDGQTNTTKTLAVGNTPDSLAVNTVTNRVYLANANSNYVLVFDGTSDNLIAVVGTGDYPNAIAVNSITNKIYVTNYTSNNVTVIDGSDNIPESSAINVGQGPVSIGVNLLTNKIYVANEYAASVTVIDGATDTATATVGAGTYPVSVGVNPTTNHIYIANNGGGETVIDGATNTPTTISAAGVYNTAVAINTFTNKAYITNYGSNTVTVIDDEEVQTVPLITTISPLPNNSTTTPTPSFTFGSQSLTVTNPDSVYFQADTWQNIWSKAAGNGATFTGTVAALQPGFHILYALTTDGQEATNSQASNPLVGAIQAYGFLVTPPLTAQTITFNSIPNRNVGTSLTLSASASSGLPVSFSSSTNGICTVSGSTASLISVGTCTITASQSGNSTYAPAASVSQSFSVTSTGGSPAVVSLSPSSGGGLTQTFTAVYSDPNGLSDLGTAKLLFNTAISGVSACDIYYSPGADKLYLYNDAGNGTLGPITPGSSSLSNSQCTLSGAGTSVTTSGTTLTVKFAVTFQSTFTGSKNIYMNAISTSGSVSSGWIQKGTWTPVPAKPTVVSLSPASGTGLTQTFTAMYGDSNGLSDLGTAKLLFNTAVSGVNACDVYYVRASNALYLYNNDGSAILGPLTPGSSSSLANSQCTISGAGTSVTTSGSTLTGKFAVTFQSTFTGSKNVYMNAISTSGSLSSGWIQKGTWTP